MEVLAKRLKWLREQKRLSQKEVAAEIGMSLNGYQKIEMNERNPKLEVLIGLSKLYNETTDFLLGLDDSCSFLNEIVIEMNELKEEFNLNRSKAELKNYKLQQIKDFVKKETDTKSKEKDIFLEVQLEGVPALEAEAEEAYHRLYISQKQYANCMFHYLNELMKVPYSNPSNDKIIKSISPIKVVTGQLTEDENSYYIELIGKDIGNIGGYSSLDKDQMWTIRDAYLFLNLDR